MNLLNHLIEFAERVSKIEAITQGHDPEDAKFEIYYFIYSGTYDDQLEDSISEFDRHLNNINHECQLSSNPIGIKRVANHGYLGEVIWRKGAI